MDIFKIDDLSFRYPDAEEEALSHLAIQLKEGEFTVVCGPSGCGKSTLLRLLKKDLAPVGSCTGEISYAGKPIMDWDDRTMIEDIGFVFQDPENQIIMDDVMQEIVFGMENLGYSNMEMRKRVAELVHFFGMEELLHAKPSELSGGQKQLLNLLSVLLLKPKVLLLDEPTSQLDPVAAKDLIVMLDRLNKEMGITIILVEHRLEELFAIAEHVIMMDKGKVVYEGTSREVIYDIFQKNDQAFMQYVPSISQLYIQRTDTLEKSAIPLTVKECKQWLAAQPNHASTEANQAPIESTSNKEKPILSVQNVYFQYTKTTPFVLKNISLQVTKGEFFTIIGGNGSGKSTLLKACIGNLKPQRGRAYMGGKDTYKLKGKELYHKIAYLPQNPRTYFIQDTVEKEMQEVLKRQQLPDDTARMTEVLDIFGIQHIRNRHPYDCSGGEMQKAALACMLLGNPEILFIDEPTKGLDPMSKQNFAQILHQLHEAGLTIIMVTHDIEFAAKHAERCAMMFDGTITTEGTPDELLKGNYFYTTSINRATRASHVRESLTLEEALSEWPNPVHI
ncbi:ABC transporter ATP-binding protein [Ornithinibacillus xuwenensis]|uniref:Energy-coupling factor transporter ATPase n=1 Tax=Ornithinibacillus xuwenensis TaxID=3144668 RepID=A0ABU9XF18_9BACI